VASFSASAIIRREFVMGTNLITGVIHRATTWSIVLSALMIAAGVLAIVSPAVAGVAVTVFFGWLLIFSGILHLAFAWQAGRPGAVVWEILIGILYGGIGFYLLTRPVAGLEALTLALAFYLVIEGVLEFVLSFLLRPLPGSGWLLVDGIVTLVIAAMIVSAWPISSVWAVGALVGVSMFFSGMTRLMLSVAVRRIVA
jgi:uncharacterized membrane protein HdeD (DUF308 family)